MAYTGFISDPAYTRKNDNEVITGLWQFPGASYTADGTWTFSKTLQGTAYRALWGDLAEVYATDPTEVLVPGTLVKFGGKAEVTKTGKNDRNYFGVVSTAPGVVLNKKETKGEKIALVGRVPVRVIGKVNKFDKLTTSKIPGVAKKQSWLDKLLRKPTIGTALATNTNVKEKLVEVFVHATF